MKKWLATLALGCAMGVPSLARAAEEAEAPNKGALHLAGGIDYVTDYYFRGYLQENNGLILQPYATLSVDAVTNDQFSIVPYVGTWNSIHDEKTLTDGDLDQWYESDLFAGVDFVFGDFKLGGIYTLYTYPNGAFDEIHELGVKLSYNDSKLGLPIALNPYVAWYWETSDKNGEEDQYAEVGIAPAVPIGKSGLTLSFPVTVGLSPDGYYLESDGGNEFLGYGTVGAFATLPLPIPSRYGNWSLTGGVTYIYLFSDSTEASNNGDDDDFIGKVGLAFTY